MVERLFGIWVVIQNLLIKSSLTLTQLNINVSFVTF